jgi:virginiamycin B lyase
VTTYRTEITGEPYGVVLIGNGAFYYDHGTSSSSDGIGVDAGTVSGDGRLREYLIQTRDEFESVAIAADGTLWAASILDNSAWPPVWHSAIERLSAKRSTVSFRIPRRLGYAQKLLRGPDGAWWFALPDAHAIGRLTREGKFSITMLPKSLKPDDIAFDSNGMLYATETFDRGDVARIPPEGRVVMFHTLSPDARVGSLAGSGDGVWFTEEPSNRVGHITHAGHVEEFTIGRDIRVLDAIAVGKDSVWFAAQDGVGRLSLQTHAVTFIPLPDRNSTPNALAVSRNGDIWLTESISDPRCFAECGGIARIVP